MSNITLTLPIPLLPWWGWLLIALVGVYVAVGLYFAISMRSISKGLMWPLWLLVCLLGASPQ